MNTVAEIRVEPIGAGVSIADEVERACAVLVQSGLRCQVHEMGTNVEGELSLVLGSIEAVHRELHAHGVARISTHLELQTRTDKRQQLGPDADGSREFEAPAPRLA